MKPGKPQAGFKCISLSGHSLIEGKYAIAFSRVFKASSHIAFQRTSGSQEWCKAVKFAHRCNRQSGNRNCEYLLTFGWRDLLVACLGDADSILVSQSQAEKSDLE
ncbi:MAG: hypothetical protein ACK55S_03585 [Planctomycetota bacterium]